MITQEGMETGGIIRHLFIKPAHKQPMRPVSEVTAINGEGLSSDASCGSSKRQVLLIEEETLDELSLAPGDLRENIVVAGLLMAGTPSQTRLRVGRAELEVTMDCAPCDFLDRLRLGLQQEMIGRRGTLCRVILGGVIRIGDSISWTTSTR